MLTNLYPSVTSTSTFTKATLKFYPSVNQFVPENYSIFYLNVTNNYPGVSKMNKRTIESRKIKMVSSKGK